MPRRCTAAQCPAAAQLALEEGGQGEQQHHGEHDRELQHQRCIVAEEQGVLRNGKGCHRGGNTAHQHQIEHVCTNDIAQRKCTVPFASEVMAVTSSGSEVPSGHER